MEEKNNTPGLKKSKLALWSFIFLLGGLFFFFTAFAFEMNMGCGSSLITWHQKCPENIYGLFVLGGWVSSLLSITFGIMGRNTEKRILARICITASIILLFLAVINWFIAG